MKTANKYVELPLSKTSTKNDDNSDNLEESFAVLIDNADDQEENGSSEHIETNNTAEVISKTNLSSYFSIYYRVYTILGTEKCLAKSLAFANVVLSIALMAEPVLFGKVINAITSISNEEKDKALYKIYPLLLSWTCFGLLGVFMSILVGLKADQMAHRHRHVVAKDFYERAIRSTPLSIQGQDSGSLYKIMDEAMNSFFWNWLNILRQELSSFLLLVILLPVGLAINIEMGLTLLLLCFVFFCTSWYVLNNACKLQKAVTEHYKKQSSLCSDVLANLPLIQAYDNINNEVDKMHDNSQLILQYQLPVLNYWVVVVMINQCATSITVLLIIVQGTLLYAKNQISVGDIVTFIAFANMIIAKLRQIVDAGKSIINIFT